MNKSKRINFGDIGIEEKPTSIKIPFDGVGFIIEMGDKVGIIRIGEAVALANHILKSTEGLDEAKENKKMARMLDDTRKRLDKWAKKHGLD